MGISQTVCILNIALDPVFIFGLQMEIAGAAIATMLSNLIAMLYFIGFLLHIRDNTVITLNPKAYSLGQKIPQEVVTVGLPGFVMTMMSTISNTALNHIVAGYSNTAVAGMRKKKKNRSVGLCHIPGDDTGNAPADRIQFQLRQCKANETVH